MALRAAPVAHAIGTAHGTVTLAPPKANAMCLRSSLLVLVLLLALPASQAQAPAERSNGNERREQRRTERQAWRMDTTKWDRMPLWSVGALIGKGANSPDVEADNMIQPDTKSRATYRVEAARRLWKGWAVGAHLENRTLRSAGLANATWIDGHHTGFIFGDGFNTYDADIVTVEHRVNTLGLMTSYYNAPFPRRKSKCGYTVSVAAGIGVHLAAASYGVERDTRCTVRYGFMEKEQHEVLGRWDGRSEFARHTAVGISALFDLRAELWLGRHVSLMLPMLGFTLPLVAPHFPVSSDAPSAVSVQAYDLDLVSTTISTGLTVHF